MPYIKKEDRVVLGEIAHLQSLVSHCTCAGELNYVFTEILLAYVRRHGLRYQTLNDIMGALEGAKLEMYRRMAAPYEDTKIEHNGDVYPVEGD